MIYLSGSVAKGAAEIGVGFMLTPSMGNLVPSVGPWAADSGCFNRKTYVGDTAYLTWLAGRAQHSRRCLFAAAPDVVGDHAATLAMFHAVAKRIRALGYPVAFVAQDGATEQVVPWDDLDAIFIGGTTDWKLSEVAYCLVAEAKARDKWVHVGRVNSFRRLAAFAHAGADSADGTFLAFGPEKNMPRLAAWLRMLDERPTLKQDAA